MLPFLLLLLLALAAGGAGAADPSVILWQIGASDNANADLALAPNGYNKFHEDGFFIAGRSEAKRDWPYVHPGPADGWAGGRQHTFSVVFGVKAPPSGGACKLLLDLIDTQGQIPPEIRIEVNGQAFQRQTPRGAGDASVFGDPARGKEHKVDVSFPASLLASGTNEIDITTLSGSWILYDWVALEAPAGLELAEVSGTVVSSLRSPPILVEREGKLLQKVQAGIRHFGGEAKARIRVEAGDGNILASAEVDLRPGAQSCDVAVPAVEKETPARACVEVEGQQTAVRALVLRPVRKWVVYLLPHSHVDIGYTHVQTDVERAQWQYLEMAMETARKTAGYPSGCRFKWNVEVLWAVDGYLQQASPEKRQAFFDAVKSGQVGLDALYGNMLTGLCRPEELLRLLRMATELTKRTGVPVESAMITDVPGYTWGIVPAFAHSGVKYFSIGPNGGDRIGHTIAAWGDKPFWWIGPNGKDKVLAWMTGTGYYRVFSSADNLMSYLGRLEEKGYPYDFVQVRHCLGDNGAPDVNFADTVRKWNEAHAYPKLVIATTAEMFRDFEARYGDRLPTARGDFTPYWEDGAGSSARETALNRASADRLVQAETLFAMFHPAAYPLRDFYEGWRNVVLYDEHTWGAYNSISEPDHPFVKSQWAIKQAFALDADKQSRKLIEMANASRGEAPAVSAEGKVDVIDVVNTTSRGYPYALVVVPAELSRAGDVVKDSLESTSVRPAQRLSTGELVFRACWPGFTARRYYITAGKPAEAQFKGAGAEGDELWTGDSATSNGIRLRVDAKTGAIASLIHGGRELVAKSAPASLNDYAYLPGSDLKGLQGSGPVKISVKERGPLMASLLVESDAPGCTKLTREIRVHALRNYVEIINTVDKKAVRAKEGVHFGFAFNVPGGEMRMDVPWAVVRPEADQIPGACKNWFTVQRWVDISGPGGGVTWLTPDAPLVQVGGITANLIGSLSDPKAWLDRVEPSQTIHSWAMNNHWHTNYRAEQEGPTVFKYYIFPHGGRFDPDRSSTLGLEVCQPLLVLPARGALPKDPPVTVYGSHGAAALLVTAFKPSDDGKAYILRIWNTTDKPDQAKIRWRDPAPASLWLSDNGERPLQPAAEPIEVPASSMITLRAERP